jgi:hypothetical protein
MSSCDFEVIYTLASPKLLEKGFDLRLLSRPGEKGDVLADGFVRLIAEDARRAGVPAGDDAVERLAQDGVVRGFHDRGEPAHRVHRSGGA